jgi:hypothetical protein
MLLQKLDFSGLLILPKCMQYCRFIHVTNKKKGSCPKVTEARTVFLCLSFSFLTNFLTQYYQITYRLSSLPVLLTSYPIYVPKNALI